MGISLLRIVCGARMRASAMRPCLPLVLFAALFAALLPAASHAAEWNIDQLMQSLAQVKSGRANFVEKKYIAMLDRPVESSGELSFTAPDHLEKRTLRPQPETMVLDGGTLRIERGSQSYSLPLQQYPELAGFIDSIRGTLAGDRKALERAFSLKLEGNAGRWTLLLKPTDARMARTVHLIRIGGAADEVRSVEIIQTDGDRSVMTITRIAAR